MAHHPEFRDYIVTDDLIYDHQECKEVEFEFYREDGVTIAETFKTPMSNFLVNLPGKSELENMGFALVPDQLTGLSNVPSLQLCDSCDHTIGKTIGIIGFQFEHKNLALKTGVISSFIHDRSGNHYIQYDGTIKPGYSGAPLIKYETNTVIGIVSKKMSGHIKTFRELNRIIDSNIEILKSVEGKYKLDDIDFVQVLIVNQNQIKHISNEFLKNAGSRVGYALDIGHLTDYLSSKTDSGFDEALPE